MNDFLIILSEKEKGKTSFAHLFDYKKLYKGKKVGHAGTLDKFATGLMIVLIGKATKLNQVFSNLDKSYRAKIKFGEETDTLDPDGKVIRTAEIPSRETVLSVLPSFKGKIMQAPPEYSAVHIDGERAYKRVQKNEEVRMPEREVEVFDYHVLKIDDCYLDIIFHVSKGTYIRSLARDIGRACKSCAHLKELKRLTIGPYSLNEKNLSTMEILKKTELFSKVQLKTENRKEIDNGYIISSYILSDSAPEKKYKFLYFDSELYAVAENTSGRLKIIFRLDYGSL